MLLALIFSQERGCSVAFHTLGFSQRRMIRCQKLYTQKRSQCPQCLPLWMCLEALMKQDNFGTCCCATGGCACLRELSVEEGKSRGDTGGHHGTRSKGRSCHTACVLSRVFRRCQGSLQVRTRAAYPSGRGKRCHLHSQIDEEGSSASTMRRRGSRAKKEDSCKQQPVVQVLTLVQEGIMETCDRNKLPVNLLFV